MMQKIKCIRSNRKTLALTVDDDLQIVVRAPFALPEDAVWQFVQKHQSWIERSIEKKRAYLEAHPPLRPDEVESLRRKAKQVLPDRVRYYSAAMGVVPTGLKITSAKKRFGSCSSKNSLCFSLYLMQYPDAAIDYVVVHELAHIRHHNHSAAFYSFVASVLPDYKAREQLLKQ